MADTVPAMLEPGEYVIRKDAAEELGPSFLNMLNNADRVGNQNDREMPSTWGQSFIERFQSLLNGGRQQVPQENNKQQGGYIDKYQEGGYADMQEDYSLLDLMMPIMDDRLGPVNVKKYEHGGDVYGGFSVSPQQIFQEQGLQWDADYGETIEEYDPTRERQLGQSLMGKLSAPGTGAGTFAGTGGYGVGEQAREEQRRGYFSGVAGLRGEHMGVVESQLATDIADETFGFTQIAQHGIDPNDPSTFPTGGAAGNLAGMAFTPPPQNPYEGQTWGNYTWSNGQWVINQDEQSESDWV